MDIVVEATTTTTTTTYKQLCDILGVIFHMKLQPGNESRSTLEDLITSLQKGTRQRVKINRDLFVLYSTLLVFFVGYQAYSFAERCISIVDHPENPSGLLGTMFPLVASLIIMFFEVMVVIVCIVACRKGWKDAFRSFNEKGKRVRTYVDLTTMRFLVIEVQRLASITVIAQLYQVTDKYVVVRQDGGAVAVLLLVVELLHFLLILLIKELVEAALYGRVNSSRGGHSSEEHDEGKGCCCSLGALTDCIFGPCGLPPWIDEAENLVPHHDDHREGGHQELSSSEARDRLTESNKTVEAWKKQRNAPEVQASLQIALTAVMVKLREQERSDSNDKFLMPFAILFAGCILPEGYGIERQFSKVHGGPLFSFLLPIYLDMVNIYVFVYTLVRFLLWFLKKKSKANGFSELSVLLLSTGNIVTMSIISCCLQIPFNMTHIMQSETHTDSTVYILLFCTVFELFVAVLYKEFIYHVLQPYLPLTTHW